jgi:hypothetical protein
MELELFAKKPISPSPKAPYPGVRDFLRAHTDIDRLQAQALRPISGH